jgi:hypothetical protein
MHAVQIFRYGCVIVACSGRPQTSFVRLCNPLVCYQFCRPTVTAILYVLYVFIKFVVVNILSQHFLNLSGTVWLLWLAVGDQIFIPQLITGPLVSDS